MYNKIDCRLSKWKIYFCNIQGLFFSTRAYGPLFSCGGRSWGENVALRVKRRDVDITRGWGMFIWHTYNILLCHAMICIFPQDDVTHKLLCGYPQNILLSITWRFFSADRNRRCWISNQDDVMHKLVCGYPQNILLSITWRFFNADRNRRRWISSQDDVMHKLLCEYP